MSGARAHRLGGRLTAPTLRRLATAALAVCALLLVATEVLQILIARERGESLLLNPDGALGTLVFSAVLFAFPVVGFLVTSREPSNGIGWLLLGVGLAWALRGFFFDSYLPWTLTVHPGSLPAAELVGALSFPLWVPGIGLMGTFLILLFPDGHLPSPRWRPLARVSAITLAVLYAVDLVWPGPVQQAPVSDLHNPLAINALAPIRSALGALAMLLPLCILACAASLVVRFRRSQGVERLQLKWLATAGAFLAIGYLVVTLAAAYAAVTHAGPAPGWFNLVVDSFLFLAFLSIPVAIGVAILKHRLYDIEVVINKAVVFGALASFITVVYVAIVVGVGSLAGRGDKPNLGLSIAATAVVAVAFQPVRDRVQRFANRLVYGARATPYEVLSDFADRMGGTYDAADLLPMMARTIAQGVGADRVDVWLGIGENVVREAGWPPEAAGAVERSTAPVDDLANLQADRVVPVSHHGELLGAITVTKPPAEPLTPAEDTLLNDVAAQAGLVLRNVRLIEELRSSRQRLISAQDEERRRLERNLHDGAQQSLVTVALMMRMMRQRLAADNPKAAETLEHASQQLGQAIDELRELARGIHPAILTDRGLGPALRSLTERSPVPVVVDYQLDDRPPETVEATLYFVAAEALTNVAKYAQASQATVTVTRTANATTLRIADDGIGGADPRHGSGLRGLTDRVAAADGTLNLHSPPDGGTHLTCTIPLPRTAQAPTTPQPPTDPQPTHHPAPPPDTIETPKPVGANQ